MLHKSDAAAARSLGLAANITNRWKANYENKPNNHHDFGGAIMEFFSRQHEVADALMSSLLPKAAVRTGELLDANDEVPVRMGRETVFKTLPNHQARAKGIEIVLRYEGKWSDNSKDGLNEPAKRFYEAFAALLESRTNEEPPGNRNLPNPELRSLPDPGL